MNHVLAQDPNDAISAAPAYAATITPSRPSARDRASKPSSAVRAGSHRSVIMSATWRDCAMAIGLLRLPSLNVAGLRGADLGVTALTVNLPVPGRRG